MLTRCSTMTELGTVSRGAASGVDPSQDFDAIHLRLKVLEDVAGSEFIGPSTAILSPMLSNMTAVVVVFNCTYLSFLA